MTVSINETTPIGTNILNLTIVDLDIETNLNLGILSGNIRNVFMFTILSDNAHNSTRTRYEAVGQLTVIGILDYDLVPDYKLVLFAFDAKNMATINLTIILLPQNTKAPYFDLRPGITSYQYEVCEATEYPKLGESPVSVYNRIVEMYLFFSYVDSGI